MEEKLISTNCVLSSNSLDEMSSPTGSMAAVLNAVVQRHAADTTVEGRKRAYTVAVAVL
jgi:hypothetical protein